MKAVEDSQAFSYQYPYQKPFHPQSFEDIPKSPVQHQKYDSLLFSMQNQQRRLYQERVMSPAAISINANNNVSVRSYKMSTPLDLVMSRSDWFACLKQAYQQLLEAQDELDEGVEKEIFLQMIEINRSTLPLITLQQYLGQQDQKRRKEKWLSISQVLDSIRDIQEKQLFWDDIIDSLLISTNNPKLIDSANISRVHEQENSQQQTLEYSQVIGILSPTQHSNLSQIKSLINVIRLKDQSLLLDYSRIKSQYQPVDVQEMLEIKLHRDEFSSLRALSLSNLQFKTSVHKPLTPLSRLDNLVILNLSALNNPSAFQDLGQLLMRNLQFLNINNNGLKDLSFSTHNFPKLKEIYASKNNLRTAKPFSKIDTIKLLDLSDNNISSYEEIVCLAFSQGLVVLNLLGNPFEESEEFEENIKQILPKVRLLNPETISKVSCFENFSDLAFSSGDVQHQQRSQEDSLTQDSEEVPERSVDLKLAIGSTASFSASSTPNRTTGQPSKRLYLKSDISTANIVTTCSPINKNEDLLLRTPPYKQNNRQMEINSTPSQQSMLETKDQINADPQNPSLKNDHLRYFNIQSKRIDENFKKNETAIAKFNKYTQQQQISYPQQQKPPQYIKIKPTVDRHEQSVKAMTVLESSEQEGFGKTERRNFSQNVSVINDNRSSLFGYIPGYQGSIEKDASSDQVLETIIQKKQPEQPVRATYESTEMAKYYERAMTEMNINRIKDMPSKEVCKVSTNVRGSSMSPISAMMITKPPEITTSRKTSISLSQHKSDNTPRQRTTHRSESRNTSYTKRSAGNSNLNSKTRLFSGIGDERYQNKTQSFNIGQIMNSGEFSGKNTKNQSGRTSRNKILQTLQQHVTSDFVTLKSTDEDCRIPIKDVIQYSRSPMTTGNQTGTCLESNRQSIRPFRLPPSESPSLYRNNGFAIQTTINQSNHKQQQMCHTSEKKHPNHTRDKSKDGLNTPRFSERKREAAFRELQYTEAMRIIGSKRKRQENKKQKYNSLHGKASRQQSITSITYAQKSDQVEVRNILCVSAYRHENANKSNNSTRLKLNIDLRKHK